MSNPNITPMNTKKLCLTQKSVFIVQGKSSQHYVSIVYESCESRFTNLICKFKSLPVIGYQYGANYNYEQLSKGSFIVITGESYFSNVNYQIILLDDTIDLKSNWMELSLVNGFQKITHVNNTNRKEKYIFSYSLYSNIKQISVLLFLYKIIRTLCSNTKLVWRYCQ
ncbi:hypothetical protein SNEBB_001041 [Seison nebaliae]|nr:hypothetical protein SNEBB_001041 [Seison nebaliae]